ncbi:hypothetical protein GTY81_17560 [Streptomyces sp. SID8366]|uniref:hypothetical protein n=1 Tax=unclassified Streptomyces TaxID=2593676 RepID=UPI000DB9132C|nr:MULTISPECIES: hypothetical protein [unclassified Streptomyces]MYU05654.1 hypothetical protein [Streptomyces sp. SID8366]MYU65981.1 hypothetical protein [Streptomyces sp. SID69]RAJ63705.1 hypothetical protein K376_00800 [Streptomyces sp. PsTaAH-130]
MRRSTLLAAATATALSASLFWATSPARADGTTGGPALSDATDWSEPGLLFVTAHSDSPLTRVTAHFYPLSAPDGAPEAGSTADFTQYSGQDARSGVWRAPVHLAELGDYRVTVDLQDASGATVTGALSPHTLQYQTVLTVTNLTTTPDVPDFLHQDVSVGGTVVARDPRDPGTPDPAVGVAVAVDAGRVHTRATTGADGRFTAAFVPSEPSFQLYTTPEASSGYPGAISPPAYPKSMHTAQAPVRFSASTHTLNLRQGTTGTVTGHAEIQTASGWQPLPHTSITVQDNTVVAGQTTTDARGDYTLRVSSDNAAPDAELIAGTGGMLFQQTAAEPFSLHVAYTTHTSLSAFLDDDGSLTARGDVYFEDSRAHWPAKPTVTLQYSKDGKTGWKDAATVTVPIRHNRPLIQETFARTLTKPDTDAYWRARFDGDPDLGTSTTKPVHLYRYATRITGFHASPDPVRKGQPISFAGTLQYKKGTAWKPLPGGSPTLYFKPRGSTTYRYVCELGSAGNGHLVGMVTAKQDGTWAIALSRQTGDHYLASTRVTDYVDVR